MKSKDYLSQQDGNSIFSNSENSTENKINNFLQAVAECTAVLLNDEDFDRAVNEALAILGESIDADRINIGEQHQDLTEKTLGYVVIAPYEWLSPGTISQTNHSELNRINSEELGEDYLKLISGNYTGGLIKFPEPFRSRQQKLGVKATYAIPVMVKGSYWGFLSLDFCHSARELCKAEINLLKTAATCIGSAIQRERNRQEKEQADRSILLEREKAAIEKAEQLRESNQILSLRDKWLEATAKAANKLLENADLDTGINAALKVLGENLDCDRLAVVQYLKNQKSKDSMQVLYHWVSADAFDPGDRVELSEVSNQGILELIELSKTREFTGGLVGELPEPLRSIQKQLGIKSGYNVPIFVDGEFWGIICLEYCRNPKTLASAEIAVFKTAASCVGSAIYRQQIQAERKEAEKRRVVQLESSNQILSLRDRWLEATANAANKLLEIADLDAGINAALKVLGEGLDCDRIGVAQHFEDRIDKPIGYVLVLHEWSSADTIAQVEHPKLHKISWQGMEDWLVQMKAGEYAGGTIDELSEPFRIQSIELGVKSTYAVPIFIGDLFWGILGIDFCREARQLTLPEIAVFKTAASCVGSAIYRQQIQQEKEAAEKQRIAQLESSNKVLFLRDKWLEATANAANILLKNADLDAGINAALKMLGESLDCDRFCVLQNYEDSTGRTSGFMRILHEWDSAYVISQIDHPKYHQFSNEGLEKWFGKMIDSKDYVGGTIDEVPEAYIEPFIELDIQSTYNVPIFVNEVFWGILCIDYCRDAKRLTDAEIAVFKTAASCVGSAIYREQVIKEKERAELAILDERNRMAREIHDTLAQAFTGISLQLEAAKNSLITNPEVATQRLLQAKNLAKEGINEARRSVRALRPEALEFGLPTALRQLIDKMLLGTKLKAEIFIEEETRTLNPEIEVELFRIAQEALTNVIRHAQATEVWIQLIYEPDTMYLQIKDNGIGFNLQQLHNEGFGLLGMRERCDRLGGNLAIDSAVGEGTEITITVAAN